MQTELMKDILTNNQYTIEYELYQSYPRFYVYKVYKVYKNSNERIFMYKITKERTDYGRRLASKQDSLSDLNKELRSYNGI